MESLKGHANIMDAGSAEYFHSSQSFEPGFQDGNAAHAAVGYHKPNAFGLWDMHGNVSEWTKDWFKFYENPTDPVTGLRLGEQGKRDLICIRATVPSPDSSGPGRTTTSPAGCFLSFLPGNVTGTICSPLLAGGASTVVGHQVHSGWW